MIFYFNDSFNVGRVTRISVPKNKFHHGVFSEYRKHFIFLKNNFLFLRIRHFGGSVDYNVDGFIEKNSDKIPKHLSSSLFQSKLSIVQNLFPEGKEKKLF